MLEYRVMVQLFLIFAALCLPMGSVAKGYLKPTALTSADLIVFKTAFDKSWRQLGLDKFLNESDEQTKASSYSEDLPIWTLPKTCDGKRLYYLDLAQYFVRGPHSELHNFGEGYTGSSGTRRLILSLDESTQKLSIIFDANIIDLLGTVSPETCADIFVTMSGAHFQSKTNSEYGIARLIYDSNIKKYKLQTNREN